MINENSVYQYIRLYRVSDTDREIVEREISKLCEFIKHRSRLIKNISYYTVTYIDNGESDGLIIITSDKEEAVSREVDVVIGFIESSFETIRGEVIDKVKNKKVLLIPVSRNF